MQYIENLIADCERAKAAKPLNTFVVDSALNLPDIKQAVYIIEEIGGDPEATRAAFIDYRKTSDRKCSKVNKHSSSVLYVGSSSTGVRKRIEQHFGDGYKRTYALQLKHWFGDRKIKITIYEYEVTASTLQIIEDAISFELAPCFGKTGGNNK